jgi:hypothetical protein
VKVIDLLNKIANGEISEDILVEFDNGYKDYCSVKVFFDRYIMDRENLNTEIEIIEDKKIEKLKQRTDTGLFGSMVNDEISVAEAINKQANYISDIVDKINEIIDKLNSIGE